MFSSPSPTQRDSVLWVSRSLLESFSSALQGKFQSVQNLSRTYIVDEKQMNCFAFCIVLNLDN